MPHLIRRSHRRGLPRPHDLTHPDAGAAIRPRRRARGSSLAARPPVARVLACGALCALTLAVLQAARPESAQAAKVTTGWVTGTIYFSKGETQGITEGGPAVIAACGTFVPGPYKTVCLGAVAWTVQANRARNRGMCLKVKFLLASPTTHWPDIYRGGYCR